MEDVDEEEVEKEKEEDVEVEEEEKLYKPKKPKDTPNINDRPSK